MANEPTASPGREADVAEIQARYQQTPDDAKCACKQARATVQKSAAQHRHPNSHHAVPGGTPEPVVPTPPARRSAAVGSDSPFASIPDGTLAGTLQAVYEDALAAGASKQAAVEQALAAGGSGSGGAGGKAAGGELSIVFRGDASAGLSPTLRSLDAGRGSLGYTPQANTKGGKR
jgi:hypothetical protein